MDTVASGNDPQSNGDDDDDGSTIIDEPLLHLIPKNHAERFPKKGRFFGIFFGSFLVRP